MTFDLLQLIVVGVVCFIFGWLSALLVALAVYAYAMNHFGPHPVAGWSGKQPGGIHHGKE